MSAPDTPASASAPCATSTISDSTSRSSCRPNLLCAQPTMHPVIRPSVPVARIVARADPALYPDMVIPIALCLVVAAIFVQPADAAGVATALEQFGLIGSWADDCSKSQSNTRRG